MKLFSFRFSFLLLCTRSNLKEGASIKLMHGPIVDEGQGEGVYNGDNPSFYAPNYSSGASFQPPYVFEDVIPGCSQYIKIIGKTCHVII